MIELYAIYKFCQLMGREMRAKGFVPFGYQVLLIVTWIVGEGMGAVLGAEVTRSQGGVYLFALLGMGAGVGIVFGVARSRPPKGSEF